ncbi:hypothetical protein BO78DRAFT_44529 [Aspergillus sclerotiicarbonarius CBS 121057]|uniref:Uncharacterized protein n=1 Tax=Aspergillus sclerotiicarbonarius (strain CBS 121057 / IBT 28362) TaxID=1448318 RepID=A0A319DRP6_ASPSB|nr:hypothetical protein BO78DRAFT_44529 [Aspergillus sclerotiicarbonarius CBS 121057]
MFLHRFHVVRRRFLRFSYGVMGLLFSLHDSVQCLRSVYACLALNVSVCCFPFGYCFSREAVLTRLFLLPRIENEAGT